MSIDTIVLGAGLAGLSAAFHLGGGVEVFEKEDFAGGHCRTKRIDGFNFDEGPHVFFGKGEAADRFVWGPLGESLLRHRAEIWNNYGGTTFGRYPVQVNSQVLGPDLATRCVLGFIEAHGQAESQVENYRDWCYASFGKEFSDHFMLRYARKIWTVEPEELNTDWVGSKVGGRISRPSLEQVVRGAVDPNPQTLNYLTEFAYPDHGGFGRLAEPLLTGCYRLRLGCAVERIVTSDQTVYFRDGSMRRYDAAISTIPLPALVRLTVDAPADVREAADRLMWNSIRCVNLGVARPELGPGYWCYFYDEDVPFFRVSFPSKFSPDNAPEGQSSISCEVAYSRRRPLDDHDLTARCVESLIRTGVLDANDRIVLTDQMDIPYAYVVFDFEREPSMKVIHDWMRSVRLYPCGRFGEWGYHWSFEAIESGQRVALEVAEVLGTAEPR